MRSFAVYHHRLAALSAALLIALPVDASWCAPEVTADTASASAETGLVPTAPSETSGASNVKLLDGGNIDDSIQVQATEDVDPVGEQDRFSFGKVVAILSESVVVQEYDFGNNGDVDVTYQLLPETETGNLTEERPLQIGDNVVIDYREQDGQRFVTTLVREEEVVIRRADDPLGTFRAMSRSRNDAVESWTGTTRNSNRLEACSTQAAASAIWSVTESFRVRAVLLAAAQFAQAEAQVNLTPSFCILHFAFYF